MVTNTNSNISYCLQFELQLMLLPVLRLSLGQGSNLLNLTT